MNYVGNGITAPDVTDPGYIAELDVTFKVEVYDCSMDVTLPAGTIDILSQPVGEFPIINGSEFNYQMNQGLRYIDIATLT